MDNVKANGRVHRELGPKAKKAVGITALAIFIAFSVAAVWFIGRPMLEYVENPQGFRTWVDAHGILGRLAFVGMMALQVVVALIPGEVLEIGAGYAFGFWEGTALCMLGALVGSLIVFLVVRTFGVRLVECFFPIEKIHDLKFLQNTKRLNLLVFIIYFIPGTPKDLLAYVVGLTPMKLSTWMLITATARIPSVITSTMGGDALGSQDYTAAIVVFAITLAISGIGLLVYRYISKRKNSEDK
ncbi:TVP38/TMEM64 family protein [Ruminococcaceae bacterium OttesenSCG-928-A11]|nr:TVP38/TMEM64 family protein [Ruminococcaceae bacterium OttesenSCG-928-A11]